MIGKGLLLKVFATDGEYNHSMGAARALAAKGVAVHVEVEY
jgi:hypothetical protein